MWSCFKETFSSQQLQLGYFHLTTVLVSLQGFWTDILKGFWACNIWPVWGIATGRGIKQRIEEAGLTIFIGLFCQLSQGSSKTGRSCSSQGVCRDATSYSDGVSCRLAEWGNGGSCTVSTAAGRAHYGERRELGARWRMSA